MVNSVSVKAPSQRQLRVGEELRHALSSVFLQESFYDESLRGVSITVSEVRVSPDLKNATAYVVPLGGDKKSGFLESLNAAAKNITYMVGKKVKLRFTPRIHFKLDDSFDNANKMENLFAAIDSSTKSDEATE